MVTMAEERWAEDTFGSCDLGDKRRTKRLVDYASRQARHPEQSSHAVCEGSGALKEGTFRLLRNEDVDPDAILEGGFNSTIAKCDTQGDILVTEDTTTMQYWHEVADELGDVGGIDGKASRGFLVHSALALDLDGGHLLGLVDQQYWTRAKKRPGAKQRKKRQYRDKEAFKWQRCSEQIKERMEKTEHLIWVCDREADIHEYLQYKIAQGDRFVVRAAQNRTVDGTMGHLWEQLKSEPVRHTRTVAINQRGRQRGVKPKATRPARKATIEVRAAEVTFAPRGPAKRTSREPITLRAVYLFEPDAPEGIEPLEWMLLTSEPIKTKSDLEKIVRCYEYRWLIEEYHRVWKTGCRAEKRRLQSRSNLRRVLAVLAFIAVRIMQLRTGFGQTRKERCDRYLPAPYWQCLYASVERGKKLPKRPPTADWAVRALAKLAGWIETKRGMPPGYLTLWKGWAVLETRVDGWLLAMEYQQ